MRKPGLRQGKLAQVIAIGNNALTDAKLIFSKVTLRNAGYRVRFY